MFVISSQPDEVALSGNPVIWKVRALDTEGMPFMWKGARAELKTTGYIDVAEGDFFILSWNEPTVSSQSIIFLSILSPSAINHIPSDSGEYPTVLAYWEAIAEIMQAHPEIAPFFDVYAVDNGDGISLWIQAREYESGWSVSYNIDDMTPPDYTAVAYDIPETNAPDNYNVNVDVIIESTYNSGNYERYATLYGIPGSDSEVAFDISEVLHKALTSFLADPPLPPWGATEPILLDTLRNYYLRVYESADEELYDNVSVLDTKLILLGGIAQNLFSAYDFFANLDEDNSLLTWYPDKKKVGVEQPEYLPFVNYSESDLIFYVEVTRYFEDGTSSVVNKYTDYPITLAPWQVSAIPVGFTQLGLNPAGGIQKYTVQVRFRDFDIDPLPEGVNYSPIRTYYVDYNYYKEQRYLMYLNSFSAPQVLRCIGDLVEDVGISRQESRHILPPAYNPAFAEIRQYDADWSEVFTYHTGWVTRLEARALQEMLIYNYLYEVSPYGYIPLYLVSESFPITATRDTLHSITLKTKPALLSKFYSNILIPLTAEQEGWLTDLEEYWQTSMALPWQTEE